MSKQRIYCTQDLKLLPTRRQRDRSERLFVIAVFVAYLLICGFAGWLAG